jgi:MFS family permease
VTSPRLPKHAPRSGGLAPFVVAAAFSSTAYIATFTAATLAARQITGSSELAGLPSSLGTIGTVLAIAVLSSLMARRGRRAGLLLGFALAVGGAILSLVAVAAGVFSLLLASSLLIGFGNAALQLSRYAAADLAEPGRRARAVGIVVWGNTVGAVLGPNLLQPAGAAAEALDRPALEGGMTVPIVGFVLALLVVIVGMRRTPSLESTAAPGPVPEVPSPEPAVAAVHAASAMSGLDTRSGRVLELLRPARVRIALVGLLAGQLVMVLIMTMTPVHVHDHGHGLATVGFVISAHTLGMFALSPVSARLVLRFGSVPVLLTGFGVLALAALLAALAARAEIPVLTLAMFLLGYGWNLGFVAGSSLLAEGASLQARIRLQGVTDVLVWSTGAVASLSSGVLLDRLGYPALAVLGGVTLAIPILLIAVLRNRPDPASAPA